MKDVGIAMKMYRLERVLYVYNLKILAELVFRFMQIFLGCTIPYTVDIERGVVIAHFHGIVMNEICRICAGTIIFQNVTLGGLKGNHGPIIGKNCIIGAGAVILGEVVVGDNVKIGANAVVLKDIPDNCTVVGVPGEIVKRG